MLGRYTTGLLALWSFKAGFFLISILALVAASGWVLCWRLVCLCLLGDRDIRGFGHKYSEAR